MRTNKSGRKGHFECCWYRAIIPVAWMCALLVAFASRSNAQVTADTLAFGPQAYVRTTGAPDQYTSTFAVPAWIVSPYDLHIVNGDANGNRRISSATITLNGVQVAGPSDLNQNVAAIDRSVTLQSTNTLQVTLASKPGSYLTINIFGTNGDHTPPLINIVTPTANSHINTATPNIEVTYSDPVGAGEPAASGVNTTTLKATLDGVDRTSLFTVRSSDASAAIPTNLALSSGLHTLVISLQDNAGNQATDTSKFTVDLGAPQIQIVQPVLGSYLNTTTPTISLQYSASAGVNLSSLKVLVNGTDLSSLFTKTNTGATTTLSAANALPQGANQIVASIQDLAGNQASASTSFNIDTTPPTISFSHPVLNSYFGSSTVAVAVQYADDQAIDPTQLKVTVDGMALAMTASSASATGTASGLANGAHLLVATIKDLAGNAASAQVTFYVDTTIPTIHVSQPAANALLNTHTPPVLIDYTDVGGVDLTTLKVFVNGVDATTLFNITSATATAQLTSAFALPDGSNTITAQIANLSGTVGKATSTFLVDTTPPTIAFQAPPARTNSNAPTVTIIYSDATSGVDPNTLVVALDGADISALIAPGASSATGVLQLTPVLADGTHVLMATVKDRAGNQSAPATLSFVVDTTPPVVSFASPTDNSFINNPTPTIVLQYSDGTGTGVDTTSIKVFLQQATNPATDITTYLQIGLQKATGAIPSTASLSDGTYVLTAVVNDLVGNSGNARATFVVDTVPPTGTIQVPAANALLNTASVAMTLLYQDDRSGVDTSKLILAVDGVSQTGVLTLGPTQATGTLPPLPDGVHTIQLTVFDRSGNSSGVISQTFTTDTTPPTIVISVSPLPNAAGWNNTNVTLTSVCGDATSGVATCPAPLSVTTEGASQVFSLTATDNAGNTAVASIMLNIAKTPPQTAASGTPAPNSSGWNNSNVTVSFVCTATTAPLATCPPPQTVSTEGAGQIISGTATDVAGNSATATATVNLDKTPPAVAITSPNPNAVLSNQTISVSGTVADSLSGVAAVTCNGSAAVVSAGFFSCTVSLLAGPNNIGVQATDVAGNSATSQITVTVQLSTATKLAFSTEPTNGTAGSPLGTVVAQVQDATGNVVTGSNASITMSSTVAGVGGTTTVAAVNGVATFSDLVFTTAGRYTLTATSIGLTSATSTPFTISAPGFTSLVFTTQPPPQVRTGQLLLPATQVSVEDGFGNVATSYNGPVMIAISNNPGRATLGGTLTQNAVSGVATFLDLSFDTAGNGYTLLASAAGQSATSAPFNVKVSPQLASCTPTGSLSVLLPASGTGNVTAYVPNGSYSDGHAGIEVVPIEGNGSPSVISTPNPVNSCASNSATGETVCVANTTDVYLISGSTLSNTLTSGSSGVTVQFDLPLGNFSRPPKTPFLTGGWCLNCGVAINAVTNTAAIEMGLTTAPAPFYSGLQFLDLGTNTFSQPFPLVNDITEDMQWDSIHNFILLPSEYDYPTLTEPVPFFGLTGGNYDLIDTSTGTPTEFGRLLPGANLDSAAEDCTTGIALAGIEGNLPPPAQYPANLGLFISDLTQAEFTTGSPGTWFGPGQFVGFPEFLYLNYATLAGTSSVAVPPGSHLAVVTSEGAGDGVAVVELPSTSGSGTPGFGDYAVASLPRTPDGQSWSQGFDPHTITAYVSPNTGRPMAVFANASPPTWLALIDLQGLLDAPRKAGVLPNNLAIPCPNCTHTVDPSYDLLANSVVEYIGTAPQIKLVCPTTGQAGQQLVQVNLTGNHTHWTQGITTASFGPGVTVESLSVQDSMQILATISIDPAAALGPRTVVTVTDSEVAVATNPYIITALASVAPSTGQQGQQNLTVNLTGQFSNWVRGEPTGAATQVNFGAGISVTALTVNSPTSMTAVLNIDPSAPFGPRPVIITNPVTGCDTQIYSDVFTVTAGALIIESVTPSAGQPGRQNLSVALTGSGTNWVQGTTTANFGPGITVASLTVTSLTSATAVINIDPSAPQQANTLTMTTGSEVEARANGFAVTSPVFLVLPTTGQQGQQNLSAFISDEFTYWVPGLTQVDFGPGITVTSVTVSATYGLTAMLNISPTAPIGPRNVTVTTGGEVDTLSNGFTVTPGSGSLGTPYQIVFVGQPTNTIAGQPISPVRLAVEDVFGNVIPTASNTVSVSIACCSGSGTLLGTTSQPAINGVATFSDLNISKTGDYRLQALSPNLSSSSASAVFAITAGPPTQLVFTNVPTAASAGQPVSVEVAVEDAFGNIVTNATNPVSLSLGTNPGGATLSGAGTVLASGGFSLFSGISLNKTGAGYSFTASSPGLTSASSPSLVVNPGTPSQLVFLTQPSNVSANGTLNPVQVAIEDASGSVVVSSNDTVNIALYQNPSGGTLSGALAVPVVNGIATFSGLSIDKAGTSYALEATLASCCFAISNNFNVLPTGPSILSLSPNVTLPGTSVQVTITALNTHFVQGQTAVNFGPGVSLGGGVSGAFGAVQVTSATTAIAQVAVAASASLGLRTVVVRTGSEAASLVDGFAVTGAPYLSSLSPSFSQPGQTVFVTIKGVFTNFQQGTTQATFGPGIAVGGAPQGGPGLVSVIDSVTAIAGLTVDPAAAPGSRTVALQTGAEQAALQNGFLVLGAVTGAYPIVSIDSPAEGSEVTSPTLVTGTATSPNLATWTLDYQGSDSTVFTTFATGTSGTVSGIFDPTLLLNGLAVIRLTAVDQSGQTTSVMLNVVVGRKLKVGVFTVSFNDLTIPVAGIPIQITRTYDSRFKAVGDFGFGWSLSIKSMKVSVNGPLGNNWQGGTQGTELVPIYCITPTQNHVVTIRLPGDQLYQFQPQLTAGQVDFAGDTQPGCRWLVPWETISVSFVPVGATPANATLTAPTGTDLLVSCCTGLIFEPPAPVQLIDATGNAFDPDQFQLTLPTGQTFLVSRTFGVQSVTDTNNSTLTITSAGITSSTGKGVSFTRDSQNRITTITDPMGNQLNYAYDAVTSGDLSSFTDQLNNTSTFTYDSNHYLLSYTDPRGVQPLRNIYDDSGRLIEQIDPSGNVQDFNHLTATNTEAWTDFLGNTTTYVYDNDGNIIQETDPLGNVTSRTFDANDNLLTETNALGQTRTYTYDASNNVLTQADPLGNTTKYTYNSLNSPLTITDPNGHTQTRTYDANGNLLTMADAMGNTTKKVYSGGLQISSTDPLGHTTNYGYDGYGNLTSATDPVGTVMTYSYDANGNRLSQSVTRTTPSGPQTLNTQYVFDSGNNLVKTTLPDGSTIQKSYDPTGKVSSTTDELGRTTSYTYDNQGHLTTAAYPDGAQGVSTYDANGNRVQFTGPSGATISFAYDALGRVTTATNSTGSTTNTVYDAVGRATSVTDPNGNVTQYTYDAAGRRTSVTNALHQPTSFVFDAAGNQVSGTDANGHTTTLQYDGDNRAVKITYPDGTFDQRVYDAAGQLVSKTDTASNATQYGFDSVGRLTSVTDALGHVTKFAYDELGNRISQTDANGNATTFQYDQRGRRTRRTLPGGQTESLAYDFTGNPVSHIDFNGKTTIYTYDSGNRLLSKVPDSSFNTPAVTFTYTSSGKRATMTDGTGTSTYQYDSGDRLIQVVKPNGTLSYTYDSANNLVTLNSGGTQVSYSYDALNRLATASEPNTGATSYVYDGVGNLAAVAYPNGVNSSYAYDTKNELNTLVVGKGGSNFAGYTYTTDAAGHRLTVAELNGRMVHYSYDPIYRLTSESVSGAPVGPNGSVSYTYDAVGNRTQTTSTLAGVPSGTFAYDADDRLYSRDIYDADGNTISSGGTANAYDFENHLIQHGGVTIVYDGDGNRVSKTLAGVTTKYLVDDLSLTGFPQVIAETSSDGSSRTFVYGLERISQRQVIPNSNSLTSFYTYDGHGSVRALTDPTGAVTDTYDYDAFGNLINSTGSTPNEFLFAGEQYDSNLRLYYNRARYFDTTSGRFWTMDAVEGNAQSPTSLHRYLYTSGDPVNRIDPTGNQELSEVMESVAIQSILSDMATFVLSSPLGQGALGLVQNALLGPDYINKLLTLPQPSAFLVGFSGASNFRKLGPISITAGLEVLLGWNANVAAYLYAGAGIGGTNFSVYSGAAYQTPDSDAYGGFFTDISVATSFLPANLTGKLTNDWTITAARSMSSLTLSPLLALGGALWKALPGPSRITYFNLFFNPLNYPHGSMGFSLSIGNAKNATNTGISFVWYEQIYPFANVRFE